SDPTAITTSDGRIFVFVRDYGNNIFCSYQTAPNGSYMGWFPIGGSPVASDATPEAIELNSSVILVMAKAPDGSLLLLEYDRNTDSWGGWQNLGGSLTSDPSAALDSQGNLLIFVRMVDDQVYLMPFDVHSWAWLGWRSLGGSVHRGPRAVRYQDGHVSVWIT